MLNLDLINLGSLTEQWVPEILLSPPPQPWGFRNAHCTVFFVVVGDLNAGCHPGMVSTLSAYYRANAMCPPDGVGFVCHAFEEKPGEWD